MPANLWLAIMDRLRKVWKYLQRLWVQFLSWVRNELAEPGRRSLTQLWARVRYRLGESGWSDIRWAGRLRRPSLPTVPRLPHLRQRVQSWSEARDQTERNIWYLYLDMFWAGIFMAAMAFNATYALRLGASNAMIGWLSSIPPLLAMAVLVPAARFLETQTDRSPWLRRSLFVGRITFVGAALAPWIVPRYAAEVVVAVLIFRTIPMNIYTAGFSPLLADVIPPRDRAFVIANRSIIMSATVAVCTFLFGRWMDAANAIPWAAFPVNYQIVYLIGTVAGMLSTYFVGHIHMPETVVIRERAGGPGLRLPRLPRFDGLLTNAQTMIRENRTFVQLIINTLVFDFGAWMLGPLYMIFFIRQLNATDGWVGLNTTMAHIGVIGGNFIWRHIAQRVGTDRSLLMAVPVAVIYPFLVSLFPNLTLILFFGVLISLINPGVSLSHTNTLYTLCPPERRASYLAIYATISNTGAFVAPMLGIALSAIIDIRWIFVIGGSIRLAGALLFHIYKITTAPPVSEVPAGAEA